MIDRERIIQMLNNFADGTYQTIDRDVVREAAAYLQGDFSAPWMPASLSDEAVRVFYHTWDGAPLDAYGRAGRLGLAWMALRAHMMRPSSPLWTVHWAEGGTAMTSVSMPWEDAMGLIRRLADRGIGSRVHRTGHPS